MSRRLIVTIFIVTSSLIIFFVLMNDGIILNPHQADERNYELRQYYHPNHNSTILEPPPRSWYTILQYGRSPSAHYINETTSKTIISTSKTTADFSFEYEFFVARFPADANLLNAIDRTVHANLELIFDDGINVLYALGKTSMPKVESVTSENNHEQSLVKTTVKLTHDSNITPDEITFALLHHSASIAQSIDAQYVGPQTSLTEQVVSLKGYDLGMMDRTDMTAFENEINIFLNEMVPLYSSFLSILFVLVRSQELSTTETTTTTTTNSMPMTRHSRHRLMGGNNDSSGDGNASITTTLNDSTLYVNITISGLFYPPPFVNLSRCIADTFTNHEDSLIQHVRRIRRLGNVSNVNVCQLTTLGLEPDTTIENFDDDGNNNSHPTLLERKWAILSIVIGSVGLTVLIGCLLHHHCHDTNTASIGTLNRIDTLRRISTVLMSQPLSRELRRRMSRQPMQRRPRQRAPS